MPHRALPSQDLWRRIRQAVRVLTLRSHEYVQAVARQAQVHESDLRAVGVLKAAPAANGPVTAGKLARELALSPAAVSAMLGRMQQAGHVEKKNLPADGRAVVLVSTASAHETSDRLFLPLVDAYERVLRHYAEEQLALVAEVLEQLATATSDALASQTPPTDS